MSRCLCFTKTGKQCVRNSQSGSQFCWQHKNCQKLLEFAVQKNQLPTNQNKLEAKKITLETKQTQLATKKTKSSQQNRMSSTLQLKLKAKHSSRNLTVLSGSNTFAYFPNINGKRILLSGESHNVRKICEPEMCMERHKNCKIYEIHNWLYDLTLNSPECLDIFIEQEYRLKPIQTGGRPLKNYGSPLKAIRDQFKDCAAYSKIKCPLNQLRYHYIDLRKYRNSIKSPLSRLHDSARKYGTEMNSEQILINLKKKSGKIEKKYWEKRDKLYKYMLGIDRNKSIMLLYKNYINDIAESIGIAYNFDEFDQYMKIYYSIIDKEMSKMNPIIDKDKFLMVLLNIYMDKPHLWGPLHIMPQDIYFLSRLFIIFDQKKIQRGPIGCRDPNYRQIKNVIFHGGSNHTDIYISFLKQYFMLEPSIYIKTESREKCIQFPKPFDFFS